MALPALCPSSEPPEKRTKKNTMDHEEAATRRRLGLILATIASPPQNKQRFSLANVSWPLDTSKDDMQNYHRSCFLVCQELLRVSNDHDEVERGTVFQGLRPGAGFKTGDFVKEKLKELPQNDSCFFFYFPGEFSMSERC